MDKDDQPKSHLDCYNLFVHILTQLNQSRTTHKRRIQIASEKFKEAFEQYHELFVAEKNKIKNSPK